MMRRSAFTTVEMLLALTLGSIIFVAASGLYLFSVTKSTQALAASTVALEADRSVRDLENVVRSSVSVTSVSLTGGLALKCTLPADGADTNGDGVIDDYQPYKVNSGEARYRAGKRVWFLFSDATLSPSRAGNVLVRYERTDDATPSASDAKVDAAYYYADRVNSNSKLIDRLTWSVDSAQNMVTLTLDLSKVLMADTSATGSPAASLARRGRITRKIWRT